MYSLVNYKTDYIIINMSGYVKYLGGTVDGYHWTWDLASTTTKANPRRPSSRRTHTSPDRRSWSPSSAA